MELTIRTIPSKRDVVHLSHSAGRTLLLTSPSANTDEESIDSEQQNALHVFFNSPDKSSKTHIKHTSTPISIPNLGRQALIDSSGTFIVAVLQDSRTLSIVSINPSTLMPQSTKQIKPTFKSTIHSLHRLPSIVIVVSATGEIAVLTLLRNGNDVSCIVFKRLTDIESVDAVCTFSSNYIILFGPAPSQQRDNDMNTRKEQQQPLVFIAVLVSTKSYQVNNDDNTIKVIVEPTVADDDVRIVASSPVLLPVSCGTSLSKRALISADIFPHCAILLFADGIVNFISPPSTPAVATSLTEGHGQQSISLHAWFPSSSDSSDSSFSPSPSSTSACAILQSVMLRSFPGQSIGLKRCQGHVIPLATPLVAISYGRCISIWDTMYHVAHACYLSPSPSQLVSNEIRHLISTTGNADILMCDTLGTLKQLTIDSGARPSLAAATRCRIEDPCKDIVQRSSLTDNPELQLHAHPVTNQVLSAAAYAGGDVKSMFGRPLREAREREVRELRCILSRRSTPTAESLHNVAKIYFVRIEIEESERKRERTKKERLQRARASKEGGEAGGHALLGVRKENGLTLTESLSELTQMEEGRSEVEREKVEKIRRKELRKERKKIGPLNSLSLTEHSSNVKESEQEKEEESKRKVVKDAVVDEDSMRLPSSRFAANYVARCLHEIASQKKLRFVIPLVDMIATGVVCGDEAMAAYHAWGEETDEDGVSMRQVTLSSIVDVVLSCGELFNVLEAVVQRVAALREDELLRIMLVCVRVCAEEANAKLYEEEVKKQSQAENGHQDNAEDDLMDVDMDKKKKEKRKENTEDVGNKISNRVRRARRLLRNCVTIGVDHERMLKCIRHVPYDDVLSLLNEFTRLLNELNDDDQDEYGYDSDYNDVDESNKQGNNVDKDGIELRRAQEYRGISDWLDGPKFTTDQGDLGGKSVMEGFVEWVCRIVDGHFSNLIMGGNGLMVASQLLQTVEEIRERSLIMRDLEGMSCHLLEKRSIPSNENSLFNVKSAKIPASLAIL